MIMHPRRVKYAMVLLIVNSQETIQLSLGLRRRARKVKQTVLHTAIRHDGSLKEMVG